MSNPSRRPRPFVRFALGATLALGALSPACTPKSDAATPPPAAAPVAVTTDAVTNIDVPRTLRLTGTLRGERETDLAANVAGRITTMNIERGQRIAKGELIAVVDVSAAALALKEAKLAVETSKTQEAIDQADCARYEQLKAKGAVTDLEYDQVTAKCKTSPLNRETAEARQSIAAKNVGDGRIRAPFAGVVSDRFVQVGEYVQASSRVVSLAQVSDLRLEFSLPEQNYPDVKTGETVAFRVAAYDKDSFTGTVSHIAGAVRDTRDVLVEATVTNTDQRLLPGMFADVELTIGQENLPSVPKTAVFESNGKQNVFVVVNGALEQRVLQPGPELGDRLSVRRGVVANERVVTPYNSALSNGQRVQ